MYCGSNKTAMASQRQIAEAMMRLIQEKPYAQITISELCKSAGISRQTFYTLFSSRENVVTFTLQAQYCYAPELPQFKTEEACSLRQLCRSYSNYIFRNRDLLRLLVENRIDYLLYDSLYEALEACDCFLNAVDPCTPPVCRQLLRGRRLLRGQTVCAGRMRDQSGSTGRVADDIVYGEAVLILCRVNDAHEIKSFT